MKIELTKAEPIKKAKKPSKKRSKKVDEAATLASETVPAPLPSKVIAPVASVLASEPPPIPPLVIPPEPPISFEVFATMMGFSEQRKRQLQAFLEARKLAFEATRTEWGTLLFDYQKSQPIR